MSLMVLSFLKKERKNTIKMNSELTDAMLKRKFVSFSESFQLNTGISFSDKVFKYGINRFYIDII